MTEHPNLSPEINADIAQSERDSGVFTKDVLPGSTVRVQTRNTLYTLVNHGDRWMAVGGSHLPEMTCVSVNGSTWGGSMIKVGFIGIGMHLELGRGPRGPLTTSPIQTIEVALPEGANVYSTLAKILVGVPDVSGKEVREAKQFVYAAAYGGAIADLIALTGLDEKRVREVVDLLQFMALPDAAEGAD